ncbi:hypothetical protein H5410_024307 [Solanum commersonii]|uniref:Uncharacterized protein n=1 Tax=Solanum commersonii TaxID=4109 RepID=A0A9J5ZLL9_SOLCO|nr:hypothetical protein H5410_024307 [Solanum commersonii]
MKKCLSIPLRRSRLNRIMCRKSLPKDDTSKPCKHRYYHLDFGFNKLYKKLSNLYKRRLKEDRAEDLLESLKEKKRTIRRVKREMQSLFKKGIGKWEYYMVSAS